MKTTLATVEMLREQIAHPNREGWCEVGPVTLASIADDLEAIHRRKGPEAPVSASWSTVVSCAARHGLHVTREESDIGVHVVIVVIDAAGARLARLLILRGLLDPTHLERVICAVADAAVASIAATGLPQDGAR